MCSQVVQTRGILFNNNITNRRQEKETKEIKILEPNLEPNAQLITGQNRNIKEQSGI